MIRNVRSVGLVVVGPVVFVALLGVVAAAAPACSTFAQAPTNGADASTVDASEPFSDATVQPVRVDPKIAPIDKLTLILGSPTTLKVKVERGSIPDAFEIALEGLPKGVTAPKATIAFGQSAVELTLTVSEDADIGPAKVTVNATSPAGKTSREVDMEVRGVPKTLDRTFGNQGIVTLTVQSKHRSNVVMQPDGRFVEMEQFGGGMVRRLTNGNVDASFGTSGRTGDGPARPHVGSTSSPSADLFSVLGGVQGAPDSMLARKFDKDGRPLPFGNGTDGVTWTVPDAQTIWNGDALVMPDGSLFVAAQVTFTTAAKGIAITKLTPTGALATNWGSGGMKIVYQVRQLSGSAAKLFAAGNNVRAFFVEGDGGDGAATLRGVGLTGDVGAMDTTFGFGGNMSVDGVPDQGPSYTSFGPHLPIAQRKDGKFDFGWVSGDTYAHSLRIAPTGIVDSTFSNNGRALLGGTVNTNNSLEAFVDSAGRTLFSFTDKSRKDMVEVRRYSPDGLADATFELQIPPNLVILGIYVQSIRELSDGRILIGAAAGSPGAYNQFYLRYWP